MEETFAYDDMNRLTGITLKRPSGQDLYCSATYDAFGRMTSKEAVLSVNGTPQVTSFFSLPAFDATKIHALTQVRAPEGVFPSTDQTVAYTGFDKVSLVKQGKDSLCYAYGYDRQRILMEEHFDGAMRTKRYVGNCEYVTETEGNMTVEYSNTYLTGPYGVFAVAKRSGGFTETYYVLKDNLGSWTTVTNRNGMVVQDVHFDPWGTPYYSDAVTPTVATSLLFDRGFTGHEHMTVFGLINMNGRVYDPVTSTFLSVDNYVQDPSSTQNFNRYAYCMNNPLKYTDPDGEWAHLVIGALIGGIVNVATNIKHIDTFGEGLAYFGIGAAAGVVGAATGGAVAGAMKLGGFVSGAVSGAASGASSGFITGSGNAWMQGANFGQGLKAGGIAAGIGAGTGALFGGLTRGLVDYKKGYSFWDGSRVSNYGIEEVPIQELYPNENFNYENYQNKDCVEFTDFKLKTRTERVFGVKQGDMGIEVITSHPENIKGASRGYSLLMDGTYQTADGRASLGYTFETSTGYSEIHISPYAATHSNNAIFKAVVGHELTHAYHISLGLPLTLNGPSENAALTYSKSVYESYGMIDAAAATEAALKKTIYNQLYSVPSHYTFSPAW